MKILIVNLLRIGDCLQAAPVIAALSRRHAGAQVDLLTFRGVDRLAPMMPFVNHWWTLDRDELQAGLGRADVPLLTSLDVLREQLNAISDAKYDLVINLTHTELSGYVVGYINAREKLGLAIEPGGRPLFHSPWFRYLDAQAKRPGADVFHHTDVFWHACGLSGLEKTWPLARTTRGAAEVAALGLTNQPVVAVQMLTSDERKNYPEASWVRALSTLSQMNPDAQLVLLAAPNEADRVTRVAATLNAKAAVLSLEGALSLLDRSTVLITGDTSIKHLACATDVRIIELSLGPSDHRRTGAFKEGSYVVQSPAACAPCGHSAGCSQPRLVCAEQIDPALIAVVADHLVRGEDEAVARVAEHARARILRTKQLGTGFWYAVDLKSSLTPKDVESILERCTWKFWLNQEFKEACAGYGSEGVRLEREIAQLVPHAKRPPLLAHLNFLERALGGQTEPTAPVVGDFTARRRRALALDESVRQREIQMKLIRSLKSRLLETA